MTNDNFTVGSLWRHELFGKVIILNNDAHSLLVYVYEEADTRLIYVPTKLSPWVEPRKVKVELWVNVYDVGKGKVILNGGCRTKQEALENIREIVGSYINTIPVRQEVIEGVAYD